MCEDAVADEVVRAFDFDVVDLHGAQGFDGDDGVPKNDAGKGFRMGFGKKKYFQDVPYKCVIIFAYEELTRKINVRKAPAVFKICTGIGF